MKFPSKELLSAVLGIDVNEVKGIEANTPICGCVHSDGWYDEINIYELAHKCKEWAFSKGYYVQSDFLEVNIYPIEYDGFKMKLVHCFDIVPIDCDSYTEEEIDSFPHNETVAIFKACEWIFEIIKDKQ